MSDTIAAIATAPGEGGIAIVRVSGPDAESVFRQMFVPGKPVEQFESHHLYYGHILDGDEVIDECMGVVMRAPHSYTREDVAEFQLHGGYAIAHRVLEMVLERGVRLAEAGEFTRRAFLNGRLDLSQAEAVMELISARGEQARRAAMHQLSGGASSFIRSVSDDLYALQAGIAACIDYPEEISEEEAASDLMPRMLSLASRLENACNEKAARLLRTGLQVALCGRPNVGKSSLLNALLEEDRAIVTDLPGTTRDLVEGDLLLDGCLIHLTDTAGMRDTPDPVESVGVARAKRAAHSADLVLLLLDASCPLTDEDRALICELAHLPVAVCLSKSDLPQVLTAADISSLLPGADILTISSMESASMAQVRAYLLKKARVTDLLSLTQPRHMDAARRAAQALRDAAKTMESAEIDLCTIDLDRAQNALSEITGDNVEEKLLDRVFSTFCVGK
ncbi:MAG: tRNA uridine-5-carboxymethylaminomethyl(34) synthesis GTPase MnmE [Clostridia bacterium]|nr:tRNA uridine-5-carboxymethylaminomethyl(34) synthesis GTPase MnmE [Clostridia bacterium]